MSFFDPQSLYFHRQKSTKKGQIIQKKPQSLISATSSKDIPFAQAVLQNYGYGVYPPGYSPTVASNISQYATFSYLATPNTNNVAISFNDLWLANRAYFLQLLELPDSQLTGPSLVTISISCIRIFFYGSAADSLYSNTKIYNETVEHINFQHNISTSRQLTLQFQYQDDTNAFVDTGSNSTTTPFLTPPSPGEISATTTRNTWNQLKQDQGLDNDTNIIIATCSGAASPKVNLVKVNGFIYVNLGVYVS